MVFIQAQLSLIKDEQLAAILIYVDLIDSQVSVLFTSLNTTTWKMSTPAPKIKAVFFDFMGTCLDWHSSVSTSLPHTIPLSTASKLALEWRRRYFLENERRFRQGLSVENIDDTLARVLDVILTSQFSELESDFDEAAKRIAVAAWHSQPAWPDVPAAITSLRNDLKLEVFVHANGSTRLQLDLVRSSGLSFNMLFSSQLLGVYKPSPEAYLKALDLVGLKPEEVVLVAAHAYDLRGAKKVGMRTVYVRRWTDDVDEDMGVVRGEFDGFLEGMGALGDVVRGL